MFSSAMILSPNRLIEVLCSRAVFAYNFVNLRYLQLLAELSKPTARGDFPSALRSGAAARRSHFKIQGKRQKAQYGCYGKRQFPEWSFFRGSAAVADGRVWPSHHLPLEDD
jgi:hypothetical protein